MKNLLIIFLVGATLFSVSCSDNKTAEKKSVAETKPTLHTVLVEARPVEQSIKLPAQLAAYQEVSIFPKVNGYVKTVSVDIGSAVSAGQLLMVLEDPELEQASAQAREKYFQTVSSYTLSRE